MPKKVIIRKGISVITHFPETVMLIKATDLNFAPLDPESCVVIKISKAKADYLRSLEVKKPKA